jgi:glutamate-1-semialdehyde 2,1-aminomutase
VRLARVVTGRDAVLGCGYHGWLDWCQGDAVAGVPAATRALFRELPFNDVAASRALIRDGGDRLAAVVVEPLVVVEPSREWLDVLRAETSRVGAVLVFDEIKTAFRLAVGGAAERYGVHPDLACLGKALANGFPLAALGGRRALMDEITRTWISSTLATESVSLAAALATLETYRRERVCEHLHRVGTRLLHGLHRIQRAHPTVVIGVGGVAEMCFLHYATEAMGQEVAAGCAKRGVLFKRTAYNFVSLAHDEEMVDRSLEILESTVARL